MLSLYRLILKRNMKSYCMIVMYRNEAYDWLTREFKDMGCVPSNPMGKLILVDRVLNIAMYAGEDRF